MKKLALIEKIKNQGIISLIITTFIGLAIIGLTIAFLIMGKLTNYISYLLYFLSAISLVYIVYIVVSLIPKIKQKILNLLQKFTFTNNLLIDYGFRTLIFASFTFVINIAYAVFNGVFGIMNKSVWYISLAFYYLILSLIRFVVVKNGRKNLSLNEKFKTYKNCGIYLLVLEVAISFATAQRIIFMRRPIYQGVMVYAIALYTFYKITIGIINLFKARKYNDPIIQSLKNISITDAAVSVLALQVALIAEFSQDDAGSLLVLNALCGAFVCIFAITIGIVMIVKANKNIIKES